MQRRVEVSRSAVTGAKSVMAGSRAGQQTRTSCFAKMAQAMSLWFDLPKGIAARQQNKIQENHVRHKQGEGYGSAGTANQARGLASTSHISHPT
jgi:hypothetical protein